MNDATGLDQILTLYRLSDDLLCPYCRPSAAIILPLSTVARWPIIAYNAKGRRQKTTKMSGVNMKKLMC